MKNNINELIELLKKYDYEYHTEGESSISDAEYDKLRRKAFQLDPANPYFASVGSDVRGGKEKLPYIMGSLDQLYDDKEIANWVDKYDLGNGSDVVISYKYDGISCMLIYRHGALEKAYSRGNGIEGADITRHVKHLSTVPQKLSIDGDVYLVVRGEIEMKTSTFNAKYKGTYKNPRNMAAGCFNRTSTDKNVLTDFDFIAYQVVAHSGLESEVIDSKQHELAFLKKAGFKVAQFDVTKASDLNETFLKSAVLRAKKQSAYELDGVVVTIDQYSSMQTQRKSKTTLNPEHSIKFKVTEDDAVVESQVVDVLWELSKSGFFKPRVQIRPVDLKGVTITYATGFNAKFINEKGVGPGAVVKISRQGDVIPYILEVTKSVEPKFPDEPFVWNETGVEILVADETNPQVKFKQVLDFVETLQVDLLREANLRVIFDKLKLDKFDYDEIISIIFDIMPEEWSKMIGANGLKIYNSLHRRAQNMTYEIFLGAVKHLGFGFGVRKAKALLSQVSIERLKMMSVDEIAKLEGFDVKTATKIHSGLPKAISLLDTLVKDGYVKLVVESKTEELKGVNVVFTGFRDPDLEKAIEMAGGRVGSSVSGKTTHVLTVDPSSNSGKAKKARELGVKIMTPEEFKDEFNL